MKKSKLKTILIIQSIYCFVEKTAVIFRILLLIVFLKGYGKLCIYKVTINRELTTFWPETKFVTPEIIKNKGV